MPVFDIPMVTRDRVRAGKLFLFAFDDDETELVSAYGTYSKCLGDARKLAVAKGYTQIRVMP